MFKKKSIEVALKISVLLFFFYSIYWILQQKSFEPNSWLLIQQHIFTPKSVVLLIFSLLLVPFNWALEALKWQKLVSKIEKLTFFEAFQGVLLGLSLSTVSPLMIGEYAGKILLLKSSERYRSFIGIFLGNFVQTLVSIFVGIIAYIFFIYNLHPTPLNLHLGIILLLVLGFLISTFLLFRLDIFSRIIQKIFKKKIEPISAEYLLPIIYLSFVRFIVFSIQFILILKIFAPNISFGVLMVGVGLIFLVKTIFGNLHTLGDLGSRTLISLYYFSFYGINSQLILAATLLIWCINVLLPALLGSLFVWQLKLSRH